MKLELLLLGINQNFWIIFLISAMLSIKAYRMSGIILLAVQTIFGFIGWAYILIVILSLIGALINDVKKK